MITTIAFIEASRVLVRCFYEEMWNRWNFTLTEELLASDMKFHLAI